MNTGGVQVFGDVSAQFMACKAAKASLDSRIEKQPEEDPAFKACYAAECGAYGCCSLLN